MKAGEADHTQDECRMFKTIRKALLFICVIISAPVFSATTQELQLTNGLKVIVREDHRAPVAFCSLWYKVGGAYESEGETGISHFLEHWMFRGTQKFKSGEFNRLIVTQGGDANAMTTEDYTMYYETVPVTALSTVFQLEADRMHNMTFDPAQFEQEKKIVMEERRMRVEDDPRALAYETFRSTAFETKPYHHPVIGWMTDIEHLTPNVVRTWYQTYYAPNNAVLIVVGDVKPDVVFALAKQYFGGIQSSILPILQKQNAIRHSGKRHDTVNLPVQLSWLVMGYSVPTLATINPVNQKQIAALLLAAGILGSGENSVLVNELVHEKKLATSVDVEYNPYGLFPTLFTISATPTNTSKLLEKGILDQMHALADTLLPEAALNRAKAQLVSEYVYSQDSLMQQATTLGVPEMAGLSWKTADTLIQAAQAVTPDDVQQVAQQYFHKGGLTVVTLEPKK